MIDVKKDVEIASASAIDLSLEQLLSEQVRDWMRGIADRSGIISNGGHRSPPIRSGLSSSSIRRSCSDAEQGTRRRQRITSLISPIWPSHSHTYFEVYNAISIPTEIRPPAGSASQGWSSGRGSRAQRITAHSGVQNSTSPGCRGNGDRVSG